ncbi:MAG: 3-oxocholest-4-en-26-oate---CoA ligase [Acidimicrobiaceae bacterium]
MWEVVARQVPEAPALIHGDRTIDWQTFDARADGVAAALLAAGLGHQDKVAQYLLNCPEYLESVFAAWKAALVPVNTNYRYGEDEIVALWDNADVVAVVFHGAFTDLAGRARQRLPGIRLWLWVDDGAGPCPDWAVPYEAAAASGALPVTSWPRSGDDLWLIYTGGTTGAPKGVMWRQDDLLRVLNGRAAVPMPLDAADLDAVEALISQPGPVALIASPLMHAAAQVRAFPVLNSGGSVVTLPGAAFDTTQVLDAIVRWRVNSLAIVGDAFAKPLVDALDAEPDRWDISSLRTISSSGALFSETVVRGLLRHNAAMSVVDVVGASEAMGIAFATWTVDSTFAPGHFVPSPDTRILDDGRVARRGNIPIGYYKDAERSAITFPVIDGERWSVPGDFATIEADGSLRLLGRGTSSINTAGEKVWPEEVEAVIKELPAVADVAVVGVPDNRLGEAVTAVVVVTSGASIDASAIIDHVKRRIAGYKAPRRVVFVPSLDRLESGKIDHRRWRQRAAELPAT